MQARWVEMGLRRLLQEWRRLRGVVRMGGAIGLLCGLLPLDGNAQGGTASLTWDAFVDAYYAYDFSDPPGGVRAYATQPARHNEFNLSLAMVRARYDAESVRAAAAFAIGTYMEANYAAEPDHFRHLFEANAGVRLADSTWLDAGVMASHIGLESAISALNWTYSRSLAAEFSPYYETGVRLSFQPAEGWSAAALVVNGWQNIRETNNEKAVGVQLQYRPTENVLLNYSNYLSDEAPEEEDDDPSRIRFFNDFYVQASLTDDVGVAAVFDIGTQELDGDEDATWWNATLIGRVQLAERWALALRGEYFDDPDQAVIVTGTDFGFQTVAGSLGLDYQPNASVLIRLEGRVFSSDDEVWPGRDELKKSDGFLVSSVAVTF